MAHDEIRYPSEAHAVIDVTAAPYFADSTGIADCTEVLCRILDDILLSEVLGMERVREKFLRAPDSNTQIGFESCKVDGELHIVFPENLPAQRIIYFPNGTYALSGTVSYTLENLRNTLGNELNRGLRFRGQSRSGVVLKLRDDCPGFGVGAERPVVSFQRGRRSNVAMSNYLENLSIDIGSGNPGAIGVSFFANNTGAVRNVSIRSSDPERRGDTGLAITPELASGILVQNVHVYGFDFGVRIVPMRMYSVLERIDIEGQRIAGIAIGNTVVSLYGLKSQNQVPALMVDGPLAQVVLVDAVCHGGCPRSPACLIALGVVHLRDIQTSGYKHAVVYHNRVVVEGDHVTEYGTHKGTTLFDTEIVGTLRLPIESTPVIDWISDETCWQSVNSFGARGDGVSDDTAAIQQAMNSGATVIYFQPGRYLIDDTVVVPLTVQRINFMFVDLVAGRNLKEKAGCGTFQVQGETEAPLVFEDLLAWESYHGFQTLVDHASRRTVVLSDLHSQTGALYRNSVQGGKVFIENCCCTIGSRGIAEDKGRYGHVPCFEFNGQQVWARQINPERSHTEILNRGSTLWVLGFKTEGYGSAFVTTHGGATEVLGGVLNIGKGKPVPAVETVDSDISIIATTNGYSLEQHFPMAARETRENVTRELQASRFPVRFGSQYFIPLYRGAGKGRSLHNTASAGRPPDTHPL